MRRNRMVRMQSVDGTERYGTTQEPARVGAGGRRQREHRLLSWTQNLATYSLKRDAQGNLAFQFEPEQHLLRRAPGADQRRGGRGRPAGQRPRLEREEGRRQGRLHAFGEKVQAASGDDDLSSFDGYKRAPSGLDYAQQRYYSSALGRFVSPDPYEKSAHPDSPDSWNRYAFVSNDPINRTDPNGPQRRRRQRQQR